MVELEVQALSATREGLLIEVGKAVVASGFSLQRQRLLHDPNGVLMTLVVRGPARQQRALEAALAANERLISFEIAPFEDGAPKAHFAAARSYAYVPAPPPKAEPAPAPAVASPAGVAPPAPVPAPVPAMAPEPEADFSFLLEARPAAAPAPVAAAPEPFVEVVPLEPDLEAIDKLLPRLQHDYPKIFPLLQQFQQNLAVAARESSLWLLGQRTGGWVFARDVGAGGKLALHEAVTRIGVPALGALLRVEYQGEGLHIHDSPLCTPGQSGCRFFSGYLEGLLGPAVSAQELSVFEVCCRSFGADACVLAMSA